jgi:hypothetical protein
MRNQLSVYIRNTVGGHVRIPKLRMRPGHVISFDYAGERSKRIPRLVFILNTKDGRPASRIIHGLSLSNMPWRKFLVFLRQLMVDDTITLIKRKYEIRGPFDQILDKPKTFYTKMLKDEATRHDIYRTYKMASVRNVKLWALDYSRLYGTNQDEKNLLIQKTDTIKNVIDSRYILNEIFHIDTVKLKDQKYKQLVIQRFGSVEQFHSTILEINKLGAEDL